VTKGLTTEFLHCCFGKSFTRTNPSWLVNVRVWSKQCAKCGQSRTIEITADPMKSKSASWLSGEPAHRIYLNLVLSACQNDGLSAC
jgi:hypothetical protein